MVIYDALVSQRLNYYTLNLNKSFHVARDLRAARRLKFFKVAPVKLQTQNIIKMKNRELIPRNTGAWKMFAARV
jgi:hypothetical protein